MDYKRMEAGHGSRLYPQPPTSRETLSPVEDDSSEDSGVDPQKGPRPTPFQVTFAVRNQLSAVRLALGLLLTVLVLAALTTIVAAKKYRHVVMVFWIILLLAYLGLAWLLQDALERDESILTPTLRRAVGELRKEHENFLLDWREHMLLLKNEAEAKDDDGDVVADTNIVITGSKGYQRPKPRSLVFRTLVKPWVSLVRRRRMRRK